MKAEDVKGVAGLRRRAEDRLRGLGGQGPDPGAQEEALGLIHELQVHQVELELQNEELRRTRDELEASCHRYSELYDFAPVGYLTLDQDGVIVESNLVAAAMLSADRARLVGQRLAPWLAPPARPVLAGILAATRSEGRGRGEVSILVHGRDPLHLHLDAVPEAPARAGPWRCRAALTDVTEQRAAAELREADRRKSEFLAMLSHELRNPLAPISSAIQVLQRVPAGAEQARLAMGVIERQTRQLSRLVDDLLDVTRISRGRVALQLEPVDLRELVRRARDDHQATFAQGGVELGLVEPEAPVFVQGDPARLAQVVGNLLHNAVKFTSAPGVTELALRMVADRAEILVRDSGMGIEPARLGQLFEPFAQVDDGLARPHGGLGLGLSLVKGLVALHGGTVTGHSAGLGRGAEFVVSLPMVPPPSARAAPREPAPAPRSVVIIEDNTDAAWTLAELLRLHDHRVEVALDGRTGVELVRQVRPDCVFCDLGLPDLNGFEVAAALRADSALGSTRLVALSGYARPADLAQAREAGFDALLPKPAPLAAIEAQLASAASRRTATP